MVPGVIAVTMGAVAVERHITLDRAMYGSDQAASLERRGLESMVGYIRTIRTCWVTALSELRHRSRPMPKNCGTSWDPITT